MYRFSLPTSASSSFKTNALNPSTSSRHYQKFTRHARAFCITVLNQAQANWTQHARAVRAINSASCFVQKAVGAP